MKSVELLDLFLGKMFTFLVSHQNDMNKVCYDTTLLNAICLQQKNEGKKIVDSTRTN